MPRHTRLHRRSGGTYYLRVSVPEDLRPFVGRREIWRSLATKDPTEATRRVKLASIEADQELDLARRKQAGVEDLISEQEAERLAAIWLHRVLDEDEEARREGLSDREYRKKQETIDVVDTGGGYALATGDIALMEFEAQDLLETEGHPVPPGSESFDRVAFALLKAQKQAMELMELRQQGRVVDTPPSPSATANTSDNEQISVAELIDAYMSDPARQRTESTKKTYRTVFRALKELLGSDTPVSRIHRRDCERIRDLLVRLPVNASQRYPGMALEDVARIADAEGLPRVKPATVNAYLTNMSALFKWGVKTWRMERNPAEGLQVYNPVADVDQRRPFTTEELRTIFAAPLYTGCKNDEAGYAEPGEKVIRRGRFWVPLLAVWTGMRLGECCQLHTDDVVEMDGVPCILIRDAGEPGEDEADRRRIKTAAGRRFVPVHPELQRIGLLEFAAAQRAGGHVRLFPEIQPDSQGYLSGSFSKWFNDRRRFLGKLGIAGTGVSFHSFRHNYRDALREAEISLERVRALGGWRRDSGGEEARYGSGLRPSTLYGDIKRVVYPDLDLSHLYEG